jgi:hypothetical protein
LTYVPCLKDIGQDGAEYYPDYRSKACDDAVHLISRPHLRQEFTLAEPHGATLPRHLRSTDEAGQTKSATSLALVRAQLCCPADVPVVSEATERYSPGVWCSPSLRRMSTCAAESFWRKASAIFVNI